MISSLYGVYDILLIDCHPTYGNIVLNALHAADYVITPALKDMFSYNAAAFLAEVLPRNVEECRNWFVLINGCNRRNGPKFFKRSGKPGGPLKTKTRPRRGNRNWRGQGAFATWKNGNGTPF